MPIDVAYNQGRDRMAYLCHQSVVRPGELLSPPTDSTGGMVVQCHHRQGWSVEQVLGHNYPPS